MAALLLLPILYSYSKLIQYTPINQVLIVNLCILVVQNSEYSDTGCLK